MHYQTLIFKGMNNMGNLNCFCNLALYKMARFPWVKNSRERVRLNTWFANRYLRSSFPFFRKQTHGRHYTWYRAVTWEKNVKAGCSFVLPISLFFFVLCLLVCFSIFFYCKILKHTILHKLSICFFNNTYKFTNTTYRASEMPNVSK